MATKPVRASAGAAIARALVCAISILASGCQTIRYSDMLAKAYTGAVQSGASRAATESMGLLGYTPVAQAYFAVGAEVEALLIMGGRDVLAHAMWFGGGGLTVVFGHGMIYSTAGLLPNLENSHDISPSALSSYLEKKSDEIRLNRASIRFLKFSDHEQAFAETRKVLRIDELGGQFQAFTGTVLRVTEEVRLAPWPGAYEQRTWIEPKSRSVLRTETRLRPDLPPVVVEWIRLAPAG